MYILPLGWLVAFGCYRNKGSPVVNVVNCAVKYFCIVYNLILNARTFAHDLEIYPMFINQIRNVEIVSGAWRVKRPEISSNECEPKTTLELYEYIALTCCALKASMTCSVDSGSTVGFLQRFDHSLSRCVNSSWAWNISGALFTVHRVFLIGLSFNFY